MRIVFDVDDTICRNWDRRPYEECWPIAPVIKKINKLYDEGHEIVLFTARGMVSCKNNAKKAEKKNREILENWLSDYGVKYTELIFGKPIADLYVDDRGVDLQDFLSKDIAKLDGGSGRETYRLCKYVKKDLGNEKDGFLDWIRENNGACNYPSIHSFLYNCVFMEYVNGKNLYDTLNREKLKELFAIINGFAQKRHKTYDVEPEIERLCANKTSNSEWNALIDVVAAKIRANAGTLAKHASYCHGDLTLCNVLDTNHGLYLIDSLYRKDSATYLMDFAKLRMSLDGYENMFDISEKKNIRHRKWLDRQLRRLGIFDIVVLLEVACIIRTYRYKDINYKARVQQFAKKVVGENEAVFGRI